MPYADQAIQRLTLEIRQSREMGCTVLKIIHGYGSSGKGGKIRTESRRYLTRLKAGRDRKLLTWRKVLYF